MVEEESTKALLQEQLNQIAKEEKFLYLTIISVCISIYILNIERNDLLNANNNASPENFIDKLPLELVNNAAIVMISKFFFNTETKEINTVAANTSEEIASKISFFVSAFILISSFGNFFDVLIKYIEENTKGTEQTVPKTAIDPNIVPL